MHFEHIIEINDLHRPDLPRLSEQQLWQGLMLRITEPQRFLPGLQQAHVTPVGEDVYARRMDFGSTLIEDQVRVDVRAGLHVAILAPSHYLGTRLSILPESPDGLSLLVRFVYHSPLLGYGSEFSGPEKRMLENAWLQSDRDCIALIRRYAAQGMLDGS